MDNKQPFIQGEEDLHQVLNKLRIEHAELEQRLDELNGRIYLTVEEQIEKKKIKKLKLQKKDKIAILLHQTAS